MSSNLSGLQSKEERVQIVPSFWNCSKAGDDCTSTGCCQVSGHTCFTAGKGKAFCNKTCTPGEKGWIHLRRHQSSLRAGRRPARAEPLLFL